MSRALRWEVRKLAAQRRTYLGLGAAAAAPVLLAAAIELHPPSATDSGVPFFLRYVAGKHRFGKLLRVRAAPPNVVVLQASPRR